MTNTRKIKRLYDLDENGHLGFSENEIATLEQQLQLSLPEKLREYYLTLGKNEAINYSHNRLLKPGKAIGFSDDRYLVFYEENQRAACWGIKEEDLLQSDPPVWANYGTSAAPVWTLETKTTTGFLLLMAIYNGTLGGLKYHANALEQITPATVDAITQNWTEVPDISWERQKVYTKNFYEVISLSFDEQHTCTGIFAGTSDQERFDRLLDTLDVDWSYISYEDEDGEEEEEE
ncbi:hypothetical protein [Chitinophaga arvensicola]|uniref:Knr4/Smi1-like domain-containing protein n=1 Tax=Chitinophaga arvensicola TaxID=29529 RepID=A0A1I0RTJ9_9BACT|nr:hypothetical protein [Chitinophaga arvensicola]SEW44739.1 hypothetical protein SAMN04488122_3371 [Chitinophaga arvensicola]